MRKQFLLAAAALAVGGLSPAVSHANLIAYDGFSMAQGTGVTVNDGTGWNGAFGNTTANIVPGMTQGNLQTDAMGGAVAGSPGIRWLPGGSAVSSGSVWVSALMNVSSGDQGGFNFINGSWSSQLGIGTQYDGNYDLANNGATHTVTSGVALGQQVFVLARVDWTAGTTANAFLWVYPASGATPIPQAQPADAAAVELAGITITDISAVAWSTNGPGNWPPPVSYNSTFDELRLGTSFADVVPTTVPEPASMALLGLGGLALLRRRR